MANPEDELMNVEQGPEWLVDLLLGPPLWLNTLVGVVVLAGLVLAGLGLYRSDWRLEDDVQAQMLENAAVVVGIMLATVVSVWYFNLPYHWDVLVGFLAGLLGAHAATLLSRGSVGVRVLEALSVDAATRERFVFAWMLVGAVSILPWQLAGAGAMPFVFRGSLLMLAASILLAGYNSVELSQQH